MHWSWEELQATPMYVRRYCLDILGMIGEHERQENERAEARAERARGG
ncbi:hypothetical protein [Streptomyces goshikiensis]